MAQLSRPYQILLGAVVVCGLIWAVALRSHASTPSEPSSSTSQATTPSSSSSTPAGAAAKEPAAPTPIYHGAAPGVEGLTRAIAKAHGAAAASQANAQQLQSKSSAASGEAHTPTATTPAGSVAKTVPSGMPTPKSTTAPTPVHGTGAPVHRTAARAHTQPRSSAKAHKGRTVEQVAVEHELAQGKTAMLLFWNPKSTVDQEVQTQANALSGRSKGTVTLHLAHANQVGMFGTITEVVHVYQTPTILIVNKHGLVSTLTGLTDVFALEQTVHEARSASR